MWKSRTKQDLIIEVWEKLDCESVGSAEIEAIEEAVSARFGDSAVESPMRIARMLADEGAALRHSEIMQLWIRRFDERPQGAEFRNLIRTTDLRSAARSMRQAENLRRKFVRGGDNDGLRLLREEVLEAKDRAVKASRDTRLDAKTRQVNKEIGSWLTLWLQSPELFENWARLRKNSEDFKDRFGEI